MSSIAPAASVLDLPPKALVCYAGTQNAALDATIFENRAGSFAKVLSGALTANVYQEILAVTGPGVLHALALLMVAGANKSATLKCLVDGVQVYERGPVSLTGNQGILAVGIGADMAGTKPGILPLRLPFRASLSVWAKSSLTETNALALAAWYRT